MVIEIGEEAWTLPRSCHGPKFRDREYRISCRKQGECKSQVQIHATMRCVADESCGGGSGSVLAVRRGRHGFCRLEEW